MKSGVEATAFKCHYATLVVLRIFRGLKPTATLQPSLREANSRRSHPLTRVQSPRQQLQRPHR